MLQAGPLVVRAASWRGLSLLTLCLLLSSCGLPLLQPPTKPAVHSYLLEWEGTALPGGRRAAPGLLVSPVLSAAGFDSSDMAYMRKAHEIEYFANHRWADAPARMLDPLLVRAAEQSGLFGSVAEAGSGAKADLRLDSKLMHLQQVCRLDPCQLQLALRVTLVEVTAAKVIASRTLSVSEPLNGRNPYAGVEAANRAVARLLSELKGFLIQQIAVAD